MKQATVSETEKTVTIDGKTFKIGEEVTKKPTPEERFLQLVEGSERISLALNKELRDKHPDTACFWKKEGEIIIEERKNGEVLIDYYEIWKVLEREYSYNCYQVWGLTKSVLEKHFNLRGCIPILVGEPSMKSRWRNISISI